MATKSIQSVSDKLKTITDNTGKDITEVQLTGRNTQQQRIMVNSALSANGVNVQVIDFGSLGVKGINAVYSASGLAYIGLSYCNKNGNSLLNGPAPYTSPTAGNQNSGINVTEWGGARYATILIYDKSAVANTINYVDVTYSFA